MKQYINVEQAKQDPVTFCKVMNYLGYNRECFDGEIENFRNSDVELITIGKMIEMLYNKYCDLYIQAIGCGWEVEYMGEYFVVETEELVDALWEAVKTTL